MGLRSGRSRKQYNPYLGLTGDVILQERHNTVLFNYTLTNSGGAQEFTMFNVPAEYAARITKYTVTVNSDPGSTNYYELRLDGSRFARITCAAGEQIQETFMYEDAASASATFGLYVQQASTPLVHNVTVEILYILEPKSRGYLVN